MTSHANLVIGVDAGGTKTTAWLAEAGAADAASCIGRGTAGPGNPRSVGFGKAFGEMKRAVAAAFADAHVAPRSASALCMGVAGAGRPEEQRRLREWAEEEPLADLVIVTGDAEPVLAAASPENVGIAVICGTGSFAWGRNADGECGRVGGWGFLFGDEGSGYAVAVSGLRAAVKEADGRTERGRLLEALLQRLQLSQPSQLIERVYGEPLSRRQIAELAEVVFLAAEDDPAADRILEEGVEELAAMVVTLGGRLKLDLKETALALAGGVFVHQPQYVRRFVRRLEVEDERITVVAEPVIGALALARKALGTDPVATAR